MLIIRLAYNYKCCSFFFIKCFIGSSLLVVLIHMLTIIEASKETNSKHFGSLIWAVRMLVV